MKLQIYTVFDSAVGAHLQPFFVRSEGEALRMLRAAVNDTNTQFHANPSDYSLVYLGEFDDSTGDLDTVTRSTLVNLSSLRELPSQPALNNLT